MPEKCNSFDFGGLQSIDAPRADAVAKGYVTHTRLEKPSRLQDHQVAVALLPAGSADPLSALARTHVGRHTRFAGKVREWAQVQAPILDSALVINTPNFRSTAPKAIGIGLADAYAEDKSNRQFSGRVPTNHDICFLPASESGE